MELPALIYPCHVCGEIYFIFSPELGSVENNNCTHCGKSNRSGPRTARGSNNMVKILKWKKKKLNI